ncbi:hypothetical protein D3C80_2186600 [compost metagenome]
MRTVRQIVDDHEAPGPWPQSRFPFPVQAVVIHDEPIAPSHPGEDLPGLLAIDIHGNAEPIRVHGHGSR